MKTDNEPIDGSTPTPERSSFVLLISIVLLAGLFVVLRYVVLGGEPQLAEPKAVARGGEAAAPVAQVGHPADQSVVAEDRISPRLATEGPYVFTVRFSDPKQERAGEIVIVATGDRLAAAASFKRLGLSVPGGIMSISPDAVDALGFDGGAFALVLEQTAFPFREVGARQFECLVPALCSLVVTCQDGYGHPVAGARLALSMEAVPKSVVEKEVTNGIALAQAGASAIHARTSGASGRVEFGSLVPGDYCFDIFCDGLLLVGGPNPDTDRLRVPSGDVVLVLAPLEFLAARIEADELLSVKVDRPASGDPKTSIAGRQVNLQIQAIRRRFPEAQILDCRLFDRDAGRARLSALVRSGDRLADVATDLPYRLLEDLKAPIVIPFLRDGLVDAGRLHVSAVDVLGNELHGVRYDMMAKNVQGAVGVAGGLTGQGCLFPVGEYDIVFTDKALNQLVGRRSVNLSKGESTVFRIQIPELLVKVIVHLVEVDGRHGLPGVSIRLRQEGLPMRMSGGDGLTEFGPYWVRRSNFSVDGWAAGYSQVHRHIDIEAVNGSEEYVVELPMRRLN